ncbi:MAG: hypothetical protein H5T72_08485 [Actinobacteria bacterium]|nr:hypothetical protein [Actinomycetota bacterium]
MRLRRYVGPDLPTVLRRIRRELGEDAVIVSTRERVEGGLLGFFGTRVVEVLAAASPEAAGGERRGLDLSLPGELPRPGGAGKDGEPPLTGDEDGDGEVGSGLGMPAGGRPMRDFVPLGITCTEGGFPRRALFFGPPGSGKTSTLGRLAWHLGDRGRVRVVSVEEEGRLSGASRWRAFWEVLGVEYLPVRGLEGLREAGAQGCQALLVDTPPLKRDSVGELGAVCREMSLAPFLAVDAAMDFEEFRCLLESCRALRGLRVVVCKVDTVSTPSRRFRWADELQGVKAYFSDHPAINVPLKPLLAGGSATRGGRGEPTGRTPRPWTPFSPVLGPPVFSRPRVGGSKKDYGNIW